jgi:threonine dehydrogenase-like Zn-dependent dehydrogenase
MPDGGSVAVFGLGPIGDMSTRIAKHRGMEAHGAPFGKAAQTFVGLIPDAIAAKMMERAGVDRLSVVNAAIDSVRRGGTISLSGVYGGMLDPLPLLTMFDKQINLRMGQANVKRWIDDLMPLLEDEDVLGVEGSATHRLPLEKAPEAYETFQKKQCSSVNRRTRSRSRPAVNRGAAVRPCRLGSPRGSCGQDSKR